MSYWRSSLLSCVVIIGCSRSAGQETQLISPQADLISAIDASIAFVSGLEPFDFVAEYNRSNEFGERLDSTQQHRIRLLKSSEDETLIWAAEYRETTFFPVKKSSINYNSTVVRGNQVTRTTAGRVRQRTSSSFARAVDDIVVPDPRYWALFRFPLTSSPRKAIADLKDRIYLESSRVSVAQTEDGLKYTLRAKYGEHHFVYTTWYFGLPNYNPVQLKMDLELNSPKREVANQRITWETVDGKLRPTFLVGEEELARVVKKEGPVPIEEGRRLMDLQVKWLPVREIGNVYLSNSISIKKFLEDGFGK